LPTKLDKSRSCPLVRQSGKALTASLGANTWVDRGLVLNRCVRNHHRHWARHENWSNKSHKCKRYIIRASEGLGCQGPLQQGWVDVATSTRLQHRQGPHRARWIVSVANLSHHHPQNKEEDIQTSPFNRL
jgi:hypothetical protein